MNRNIITEKDAQRSTPKVRRPGDLSATPTPAGTVLKADTYFDRLSKYVPTEIIGAYLILEGLLKELLEDRFLSLGLLILFLFGSLATWFFARRVLKVIRMSQLAVSTFGFLVWVFATGGWFATLPFWAPGWGTVSVIVFAVIVRVLNIDPLPSDPSMQLPASNS